VQSRAHDDPVDGRADATVGHGANSGVQTHGGDYVVARPPITAGRHPHDGCRARRGYAAPAKRPRGVVTTLRRSALAHRCTKQEARPAWLASHVT
jgi:hypothetical protein